MGSPKAPKLGGEVGVFGERCAACFIFAEITMYIL